MTVFPFDRVSPLPSGWGFATAGDLRRQRSATFNPSAASDEQYELWSIPSHASGAPEVVAVSDIGSNKQHVSPGDVLISRINPRLNRTWVVKDKQGIPQIASTEWMVLPHSRGIDSRFLATLLSDSRVRDVLAANASGIGGSLTRVRPELFDKIHLPIPPLNEQRRIVESIEFLFDEIDKGVESLRDAKHAIGLYRQSLLESAFEGRLTADWRAKNPDKLEDPELLFARIREETETRHRVALEVWERSVAEWREGGENGKRPAKPKQPVRPERLPVESLREIPEGWFYLSFGALARRMRNGISVKPDEVGPLRIFRISAVRPMAFDLNDFRRITDADGSMADYRLRPGDLVFTRYNGSRDYVGVSALYRGDGTHVYPDKLIRCQIDSDIINAAYLEAATNCGESRSHVERRIRTTAGQSGVSGNDIRTIPVPICSPAEQAEIVRILDARLDAVDTLQAEIDINVARADALKQSILNKAFSGQLVSQDPSDEPASALLARIRAAGDTKPVEHGRSRTPA